MKTLLLPFFLSIAFLVQGQTPDTAAGRVEIDSLLELNRSLVKERKYAEAHQVIQQAEEKCLAAFGEETALYGTVILNKGRTYDFGGDISNAERFYTLSKNIRERILGKKHPDYAISINNLAYIKKVLGKYEKAEILYLEAIAIWKKAYGKDHRLCAAGLKNLAILYEDMGQYEKAEPLYLEAKAVRQKIFGKDSPRSAWILTDLGGVYTGMGQYEKAETHYLEAKATWEKIVGKEHPNYAGALINLGNLHDDMKQYDKAEQLHLEAKLIFELKLKLRDHPFYLNCLNNLGRIYYIIGQSEKAESMYLEAKTIRENVIGKEHPDYAQNLENLAIVYNQMGHYDKAERKYLEAKAIREKVLGKEHLYYSGSLIRLAIFYWDLAQHNKALQLFMEANQTIKTHLVKASQHLSERELSNYTNTFVNKQNQFLSFASQQRELSGNIYDNSLFYKGFLLNATQQVNRLAQTDSLSKEMFLRLKGYNRRLAKAYSKPVAERDSTTIANLEEKANTIEKELTRSVAGFGEALKQVNWQEVQAQLQAGEAAIEFVDYQYYTPDPTDSIMYAALMLRPGDQEPQFIPLFEVKSLDSLLALHQERRADYVNDLYSLNDRGLTVDEKPVKSLYELIWQPLEKELEGIQTVYFAPSGLLHRINLNAIPVNDEETITDQFKLVQLQSTRSLVTGKSMVNFNDRAVLYGGIQYESDSMAIALANENLLDEGLASRGAFNFGATDASLRGGKWNFLKWTQREVESIQTIFEGSDFKTTLFSDYAATEESFRALGQKDASPRILHLATHGFFFPDPEQKLAKDGKEPVFKTSNHPMIRSGLIMAGGNHVWQGNAPLSNMEDGILTAYEISQMDLSNTELVVLSACETGLGDIEGNEGVYGLQRAFKIAGAKYLIMSLWQIPDRQTKDFMVTFYQHCLPAGQAGLEGEMSIPDAFRKTQQEMKERFYDPYQWAGFVLVE